jgi:hypothetical protein
LSLVEFSEARADARKGEVGLGTEGRQHIREKTVIIQGDQDFRNRQNVMEADSGAN